MKRLGKEECRESVSGLVLHSCQGELSRFVDDKRRSKRKTCQENEFQEMTPTAVTTTRPGIVPIGSPFSLLKAFPL